jgi:uncharacterized repeat protein (TIGR01451 family)
MRLVVVIVAGVIGAVASSALLDGQTGLVPGRNVNVIAGTGPDGDWTLQRQNEPSMACSSRNPLNCLAGANDYRTVDIPFPDDGDRVIGDAWLGLYTTRDGGQTWTTRLLPGFPQDQSAAGLASPLKGHQAGADPVVRAGANGLFFYAGIAFDRSTGGKNTVFVARFIDNNDNEGVGAAPIAYLGTTRIQSAPAGTVSNFFLDKPWIAVDVPRPGAAMCQVGGGTSGVPAQSFPCSRVYVAYTAFQGPNEARGTVMLSVSENSGATWSAPVPLSAPVDSDVNNDGATNGQDVRAAAAGIGGVCQTAAYAFNADVNIDCVVDQRDIQAVTQRFGTVLPIAPPLHQGAALGVSPASGTLHVAWRQFASGGQGRHEIQATTVSGGGRTIAPRVTVATLNPFDQRLGETRFRSNAYPSIAIDGTGRVYAAWTTRGVASQRPDPITGDARVVMATSPDGRTWTPPQATDNIDEPGHQYMPTLAFSGGRLHLVYYDQRDDRSLLFGPGVDEGPILSGASPRIRHTTDVMAGDALPGAAPVFHMTRVSSYARGALPGSKIVEQMEFYPPNLPLFRLGTVPFIGDYIDAAPTQPIVRRHGTWQFNTAVDESSAFHAMWADNRDVRPPPDGDWTKYTPPIPSFLRPTTSGFDPGQAVPECVPGFVATRNQNIYTSRISEGLVAAALGNARRIGAFQRAFATYVQNTTTATRGYRLTIDAAPGVSASFHQFDSLTTLDVQVPPRSTVARSVFVAAAAPGTATVVRVVEIANGVPVTGGARASILLNADPSNPDVDNPDVDNPDVDNPDVDNPDVDNAEVYNPDVDNGVVVGQANPDVDNPDVDNPDVDNVVVENPAILTADPGSPDVDNPDVDNPDVDNPDVDNLDLVNGSLADTTWTVSNRGNTAAAYTLKLLMRRPLPEDFRAQVIVYRVYKTPAAQGCVLATETQNQLLINLPDPSFLRSSTATTALANPDVDNPDVDNMTVAMAPGDELRVTLRVFDPNRFDAVTYQPLTSITPAMVAQAVDTLDAAAGDTTPDVAMPLVGVASVPAAPAGAAYSASLGTGQAGTWSVVGGDLPAGLTLSPATGVLSGTATAPGDYTFTVRFASANGVEDYQTLTLTVAGAAGFANLALALADAPDPVVAGGTLTYTAVVGNAGPIAATGVLYEQWLPVGATLLSATPSQGACTLSAGPVRCQLGTIASAGGASVVLTVSPGPSGVAASNASVSAAEPDAISANNAAATSSFVQPFAACTAPAFAGPFLYPTGGGGTFEMVLSDVTGDAVRDAVVSSSLTGTIRVLPGTPAGGFGAPILVPAGAATDGVHAGDFDRDSVNDIVVATETNDVVVLRGLGGGTFAAPVPIAVGATTFNVRWLDVNHDGYLDVVVGTQNGRLAISLNATNGSFGAPSFTVVGTGIVQFVDDDFNGDGAIDLAVSDRGTGQVVLLHGNGAGAFTTQTTFNPGPNARVRRVGDLNLDGRPDLEVTVAAGVAAQTLIYLGTGAGGFSAPIEAFPGPAGAQPNAGDINGDGIPDLVTGSGGRGVVVQLGVGDGTFGPAIRLVGRGTDIPKVVDVNGDQRPDIVLSGGRPAHVQVFVNRCGAPAGDLGLTASAAPEPVNAGVPLTYSATVSNAAATLATGVIASFSLSNGANVQSATPSQGACTIAAPDLVTCALGNIPGGGGATVQIVSPNYDGGATVVAAAGVTAEQAEQTPGDNAQEVSSTIVAVPLTLTVISPANDGAGSLRQAISWADLNNSPDSIVFNLPGPGPHLIQPDAPFVTLISTTIDGTTQPGYAGTPLVQLDGLGLPASQTGHGLVLSNASAVRGLAIGRFPGIGIQAIGTGNNVVAGNFVGTDTTGTVALPNSTGVRVVGSNNTIGQPGAPNVVSGNTFDGVRLEGTGSGNVVQNNLIGTTAAGTAALPNGVDGLRNDSSSNTLVNNVVSGNGRFGINLLGSTASGNTIAGNRIGTDPAGTSAVPNVSHGINVNGGSNNLIANAIPYSGNIVAFNGGAGIVLAGATNTSGNNVGGNRILANAGLGIDLGDDGPDGNDAGDTDTGPNGRQNSPVLTAVTSNATQTNISGTLNTAVNATVQVFFYQNAACDPSGRGEGQDLLVPVTPPTVTDGAGNLTFNVVVAAPSSGFLTAAVTHLSGGLNTTSEFSNCVPITIVP